MTFPYHAEYDIMKGDKELTMAIIVLHGAQRDADNYFAPSSLHKDQSYRTEEEVLVIARLQLRERLLGVLEGDAF